MVALKDNFDTTPTAVDLTNATSATFSMRTAGSTGTAKIEQETAAISGTPTDGVVTYSWAAGDTDTAGDYEAEVEITWNDTKVETFPNSGYWDVTVVDDIA